MAFEVVMPRLGWTMEEGTLVEWLKASGKSVQTGEILFTVESDKALNEVVLRLGGPAYSRQFARTRRDGACWYRTRIRAGRR